MSKSFKKDHELIERFIKSLNYSAAMIYVDKILSQNPNDFKSLVYKSKCEMATGMYPDAQQTLITAMSLQPEKPLPAVAFVSLSDKFEVNEEKLKTALELMRKFSQDNGDIEKYQVYTLKMLNLGVRVKEPIEQIRSLLEEVDISLLSKDDKFNTLIALYDRDADLNEDETVFLFEMLHQKILKFSGNLDCDNEALDLYKKYCDLGYKSQKLSELFDVSNSIFLNSPDAWVLHSELLNLIQLDFCTKLAESFEMPKLDENSILMLENLSQLPDDGRSVKPTIRNISHSILFFTQKFVRRSWDGSFDKHAFIESVKLNQSKLISAFSVHNKDFLLGIIILYVCVLTKTKLDATIVKMDLMMGLLEFSKKLSTNLKVKLKVLLKYIELMGFQNMSKIKFEQEVIDLCNEMVQDQTDKSSGTKQVKFHSAIVESYILSQEFEKAHESLKPIADSNWEYWYLKALLNRKMSTNKTWLEFIRNIEEGLEIDPHNFDLLLIKIVHSFKEFINGRKQKEIDADENIGADRCNLDEVLENIEKLEILDPFSCEVNYAYGLYFYASDLLQDALESFQNCFEANPLHLKSIKIYGRLLFELISYETLVDHYRRRLACFDSKTQYKIWLRLAIDLFSIEEYHFSAECISQCRTHDRKNHLSWLLIAVIFYKTESYQSSLNCALEALKLLQKNESFLVDAYKSDFELKAASFIVASSRLYMGQLNFARDDFKTALTINRDSLLAICEQAVTINKQINGQFQSLAGTNQVNDNLQSAISSGFESVERFPTEALAWKVLADALMLSENCSKSEYFEIPGYVQNKQSRTTRVNKSGMLFLAYKCYKNVIRYSNGINSPNAWRDLAKCCFALKIKKFLELSLLNAKIAVSLDESSQKMWMFLGSLAACSEVAHFNLAQHSFLKAFSLDEDDLKPLGYLGLLYFKTGKYESASKVFDYIQQIEPSNSFNIFYNQIQKSQGSYAKPAYVLNTLDSKFEEPLKGQYLLLARNVLESSKAIESKYVFRIINAISNYVRDAQVSKREKSEMLWMLGVFHEKLELPKLALNCYLKSSKSQINADLLKASLLRFAVKYAYQIGENVLNEFENSIQLTREIEERKIEDNVFILHQKCLKSFTSENLEVIDVDRGENSNEFRRTILRNLQKGYFSNFNPSCVFKMFFELIKMGKFCTALQLREKIKSFDGKFEIQKEVTLNYCVMIELILNVQFEEILKVAQKNIHRKPWLADNWSLFIYSLRFYSKMSANSANFSAKMENCAPILSKFCDRNFLSDIIRLTYQSKASEDLIENQIDLIRNVGIVCPESYVDSLTNL